MKLYIVGELEREIEVLESYMKHEDLKDFDIQIYKLATKNQFDEDQYNKLANTYIGKTAILSASIKYEESTFFIERVVDIPRAVQQRIAGSGMTDWNMMISIFNEYSDECIQPVSTLDIMKQQGKDVTRIEKVVDDLIREHS